MSMLIPKNIFADAPLRVLKFLPLACAILFLPQAQSAVIDLSKPVSESITPDGIYWKGDAITTNTTPDSSSNGYTGTLEAGAGTPTPPLPSLVPGVFSNAIRLVANTSDIAADRNSRIYRNTSFSESGNALSMNATDFTGGAWLNFTSLTSRAQQVMIMDRGTQGSAASTNGGGWSFFLEKNAAGLWKIGFTARDNSSSTTVYNSASFSNLGISLDQWIHLGFAFDDKDGMPNSVTFYINGTAVSTVDINRDITVAKNTNSGLRFSVGERGASTYTSTFDGSIDDLFVTKGLYTFQAAVPEPGSVALITLAGGGVLAIWSKRRNKRASR